MTGKRFFSLFATIVVLAAYASAGVTYKVLYQFTGGTDGGQTSSSLTFDAAGNLYGTTSSGGDLSQCRGSGCGVVFQLTPSTSGEWQETVLYAFQGGSDGSSPSGNLLFDKSGNLYGTTTGGGTDNCSGEGCGTVFELSPKQGGGWTESVVYSFQGQSNGWSPVGLTAGPDALFGITTGGGAGSNPVVYELSKAGETWTEETLYVLSFGTLNPALILDGQGNLYGTYYIIDVQFCIGIDDECGTVFELQNSNGTWTETNIHDFDGGGTGGQPAAGVIYGRGSLYGTAATGGNNKGIVFEMTPSNGAWTEKMIYNFCSVNNCTDGSFPLAGVVMNASGVLYGTTSWGGTGSCATPGCGVVFQLAHTKSGWSETVLHNFQGADGSSPDQNLILDKQGNIYGVAGNVVFEITP
jgi:uncharacterized repeat protein (TIGR03803 family)